MLFTLFLYFDNSGKWKKCRHGLRWLYVDDDEPPVDIRIMKLGKWKKKPSKVHWFILVYLYFSPFFL